MSTHPPSGAPSSSGSTTGPGGTSSAGSGPSGSAGGAMQPPPAPRSRGQKFQSGLANLVKAVWFLISLLIYGVGLVFYTIGRSLIAISGWNERHESSPPKPSGGH